MDKQLLTKIEQVGYEEDGQRAASFVQSGDAVVETSVVKEQPLVLMATGAAAARFPELVKKYWWKAVARDTDEYTAATAGAEEEHGYFVHVKKNQKIAFPVQACIFLNKKGASQKVHNVVIVEDGAELNMISGCASDKEALEAEHLGISEMYVGKGAKLTFTMLHAWAPGIKVRPRTTVLVEEKGTYISNYINMEGAENIQMNPLTRLMGTGAVCRLNSVLVVPKGSHMDVGGRVMLEQEDTKAEIITRTICLGGEAINRGTLAGKAKGVKAHLECHGLMLAEEGYISAIPQLDAFTNDAQMSHEAAVGRIAPEEIEYLMARGLDEEEATATIVRGFLNVNIEGLPAALGEKIKNTLDSFSLHKGM